MTAADYYIFGVGFGASDVRYIGWMRKSLQDMSEQIHADLTSVAGSAASAIAEAARGDAKLSIFEIESVRTAEDARDATCFWHQYFRSLGLDVIADQR